ncbi:hypothetical protein [Burkholderia gladioli]|uniref:hypothetical protein n=1 Tax=Burkholderia gladioli TaxID=28095 RepID=UPI0016414334|nr:hypothetical protein [Burkholderia gladioli]
MSDNLGWKGCRLKHADGRTGIIVRECPGFCHVGLKIRVDGSDADDWVNLNSNGPDTGTPGWEWNASVEAHIEKWLPLGDFTSQAAVG